MKPFFTHGPFLRTTKRAGYLLFYLSVLTNMASAYAINANLVVWQTTDRTITGTVTDENGVPLLGAAILVKGTSIGTVTDFDGNYEINVPDGSEILIASYVGYTTQEVNIDGRSTINFSMAPDSLALDEVVLTGYTSQRQRDITGAVAVVDTEEMNKIAAPSFAQKLEGQTTGLTVSTSGEPGEGSNIRIRGFGSFTNNDPLYIIDGVPVQDAFNTAFNPNDIESIQVLKDAASASIYGARANNGVIIITTKKGRQGTKPKVQYDAYFGIATPVNDMDYLIKDPLLMSEFKWDRWENAGITPSDQDPFSEGRGILPDYVRPYRDPVTNEINRIGQFDEEAFYRFPDRPVDRANKQGTDWFNEIFNPALIQEHNVSVSGATQNANYYFSTNYLNHEGTMIHNYFERASLRANTTFKIGRLTIGENLLVSRSSRNGADFIGNGNQVEGGMVYAAMRTSSLANVYDITGEQFAGQAEGVSVRQPVAALTRNKDNEFTETRILANAFLEFELLKGLKARTTYGVDISNGLGVFFNRYDNTDVVPPPIDQNGLQETWSERNNWNWTNTLTYDVVLGEKHSIQALLGYEAVSTTFREAQGGLQQYFLDDQSLWYLQPGLANGDTRTIFSTGDINKLASAFAKLDYSYDDKYLISLTYRRDGSSNFGSDTRWGNFPAFSAGWRISEESFLENVEWLDDLKLRYSWGKTGNQAIPSGNAFNRYGGDQGSTFYDITGANTSLVRGFSLQARGDNATRWEENISSNFGLDLSMWQGKVSLVVDVYKRTVDGLLVEAPLPATAGLSTPPFVNLGEIENNGIDIGLQYRGKIGDEFRFNTAFNFSRYVNEVVAIDGDTDIFFPTGFDSRIGLPIVAAQVGSPLSSFWGLTMDGFFDSQAEIDSHAVQDGADLGRIKFVDINNDGVINDDDKGIIGNPHPDFTLGVNLGFEYKNFDFSMLLFASIGNEIFNYTHTFDVFHEFNSNVRKDAVLDAWSPDNLDASYPRPDASDTFSNDPSTFYVDDGSYLRAKNMQLGYTFPKKVFGNVLEGFRLYLQAQNLFTITGYDGLDPAISNFGAGNRNGDLWNGFDVSNYPSNRVFQIGFSAQF